MEELVAGLRRQLAGDVRADAYTRHLYASDASMYAREPVAVAFPKTADDVAAAIVLAGEHGVPVVTRGAGTSLTGQTIGAGALVLDTSRHMDAIGEFDTDALKVTVGPGVVQEDLNRAAHRHGLGFGPDTSTSNRATIGGMIGNNSSGSHSIVYGTTVDHVHELEVVLADGARATLGPDRGPEHIRDGLRAILRDHGDAIATGYPKHWRRSGGYGLDRLARDFDLAKLVPGSEGTLVAITEATVGLVRLPKARMFAVGHFESVADAIAATDAALALEPAAVELIDRTILALSRSKLEYRRLADTLEGDPGALLFVTVFADTPDEARAQLDTLEWDAYHTIVAETAAEQEALTNVRKAGLGLLMAASEGARRPLAFVEDTAVAPERLGEYVERFKAILDARGLTAGWYGHASVGCLHVRPFVDLTEPGGIDTMSAVAEEVFELVDAFGGVNSSEHGDGRVRSAFNRRIFGDELYEAMRRTKALFDPHNRLNPGVMVDPAPITADLRDPALPPAGPITTRLAFEGGMRAAADRCQRIGACRKTGIGVMCPSYMATREEEHATRGRANALVKALSQPDPRAAMGDARLHEILDLCLECKACKSECPLSVDMASLKAEFLSHYQDVHGVPLRSKIFGSIRRLNRLGAATAPVSNVGARFAPLVGIARERPLPRFTRKTLVRTHRQKPGTREAVWLADSFTTFTEPAVGRAAIELLEAAGYSVRLESGGCCGRASISKGLLDQARTMAADMTARLAPFAERGVPIVGCEPSCLLTLREEHLALQPEDARARTVADQARLVEELLVEAIDDGSLTLRGGPPRRIVFHGHCHQKALAGTTATVELLRRIPGAEVVELDAGCCGMAGSFGFEKEHYELSMQIGESRLFPALRAESGETLVAATGVSCRQQISHGVGREARHPVQIVREAL
ncbi:MAG TPA: FAD-linked oxidase C-terminal domain-containing protein [Solirubrobacteraceae bacterium]|nr:FAD-linked oxidase C-terminal domain-containing protein [Solirubrobacteraceae bacterium]